MAGAWQNVALFLGDDGNNNAHVTSVDNTAKAVEQLVPAIQAKRVFWDMYTRVSSATGNTYPEVTSLLKKQQAEGALLFDYAGHGRPDMLSHELVLSLPTLPHSRTRCCLCGLRHHATSCLTTER